MNNKNLNHSGVQRSWVAVAVLLTALWWAALTWVFWTGFVGSDDLFYSRYAYFLHRPPMLWWEFRLPAVMAIRLSFFTLGVSEFAAALPTLLSSVAILTAIAWVVDWPRKLTWQTQFALLIAAAFPLDVSFRSVPGANFFACGIISWGMACWLRGSRPVQFLGSALLALGFGTHEMFMYCVGIFCLSAVFLNRKKYWGPMLACICLSAGWLLSEAIVYNAILGHPFARFRMAASTVTGLSAGYDPDTGLGGIRFYTWPLENLFYAKTFGINLGLLFLTGTIAWKQLTETQRIILLSTFGLWAWLGYGSQVPWAYKPIYRQMHYYGTITFAVGALLPFTVHLALKQRQRYSQLLLAAAFAIQLLSASGGGRWGQDMDVSRDLLAYANQHPDRNYVTDAWTLNEMYVWNRFRMPANVRILKGSSERHLLVNKEPAGSPPYHIEDKPFNGILINAEGIDQHGAETEFLQLLKSNSSQQLTVSEKRYKWLFAPVINVAGERRIFIRSLGGRAIELPQPAAVRN